MCSHCWRFQADDATDESPESDSARISVYTAVEKVPGSEVYATEVLQSLYLHLQNPEPSLWVLQSFKSEKVGRKKWNLYTLRTMNMPGDVGAHL